MRFILLLLPLLALATCAVVDRDGGQSGGTDPGYTTQGDTMAPLEEGSVGTVYTPAPNPSTSGAGVVRPRGTEGSATESEDPARPGTDDRGNQTSAGTYPNAPGTPTAYGTTATTPQPYGSPPPTATPPAPAGDSRLANPDHAVTPNTTIPATPSAYDHVVDGDPETLDPAFTAALSGLWRNAEDPDEVVEFTPSHYTTFYDGEMLIQEPMTVHRRCPGDCSDGVALNIPCFTITGPAGIDCFGVVRLTATELGLKLLGVSPEVVTYRRER